MYIVTTQWTTKFPTPSIECSLLGAWPFSALTWPRIGTGSGVIDLQTIHELVELDRLFVRKQFSLRLVI